MDSKKGQNKINIEFKNILIDINTLMNIDESDFKEFYKKRGFSNFSYLENFVDELNDTFLKNVNKNDTLEYYLFELNFWNRQFVINNNELIFKHRFDGTDLSFRQNSILEAYDIYDIVLTEITLCCSKYSLDFYKLCDEIDFDYSFTDTGLIGVFNNKNSKPQQIDSKAKFTIKQVALKLVYENKTVNEKNTDSIIKECGHTSGKKLLQEFNFYNRISNRTANPDQTKKILQNKIKLFESVIDLLEDDFKPKAIDELNILNNYLLKY